MNLFGRSQEKKDKGTVKETLLGNENNHANTTTPPENAHIGGFRDKFNQAKTLKQQHKIADDAAGTTSKKAQAQVAEELEAQLKKASLKESLLTPKEREHYKAQQAEQSDNMKYVPPSL